MCSHIHVLWDCIVDRFYQAEREHYTPKLATNRGSARMAGSDYWSRRMQQRREGWKWAGKRKWGRVSVLIGGGRKKFIWRRCGKCGGNGNWHHRAQDSWKIFCLLNLSRIVCFLNIFSHKGQPGTVVGTTGRYEPRSSCPCVPSKWSGGGKRVGRGG